MSQAAATPLPTPLTGEQDDLLSRFAADADRSALLWASGYLAGAARALDATVAAVTEALRQNETVTLVGFGSFYVGERAARTGRNPRTGKNIKIKAAKVPKFRAGKGLKDSVN